MSDLRTFHNGTQTVALTKIKAITSYESWRQNLIYVLSLNKDLFPSLMQQKRTAANTRRGITNDGTTVAEAQRLTATQKNAHLDLLLSQIANFYPVISRNSVVKHTQLLWTTYGRKSVNIIVAMTEKRFDDWQETFEILTLITQGLVLN